MESRYVQLEYGNAISGKKQILSSEMNAINIMTKISRFRFIRKEELAIRSHLKTEISSIKEKINNFQSYFPEEEIKPLIKKTDKRKEKAKTHFKSLDQELDYIKKKLADLG
jgi:hypothetical protein